jgi:hypothetical protein
VAGRGVFVLQPHFLIAQTRATHHATSCGRSTCLMVIVLIIETYQSIQGRPIMAMSITFRGRSVPSSELRLESG